MGKILSITIACLCVVSGLCLSPLRAADLPVKNKPAPVVANPFGAYAWFGGIGGWSNVANELTAGGETVLGTGKQYPTGFGAGGGFGVGGGTAIGYVGLEASLYWLATAQKYGTAVFGNDTWTSRTGDSYLMFQQVVWRPFSKPMAFTGWQWAQGVDIGIAGGAAEKHQHLCLTTNVFGPGQVEENCGGRWLVGYALGPVISWPIAPSADFRLSYNFIGYNNEHVQQLANPVFSNVFHTQNEQVGRAEVVIKF